MFLTSNEHVGDGFVAWTVGKPPPIPAAPYGASAILVTLSMGVPTMVVNFPGIVEDDLRAFLSPLFGIGLYQSPDMPVGAISILLRTSNEEIWTLSAPILDDDDTMFKWAEGCMDECGILIALVDSNTGLVCSQKIFGLPERLVDMVRVAIKAQHQIDQGRVLRGFGKLPDHERWKAGTQWRDTDNTGEFTLCHEQVS